MADDAIEKLKKKALEKAYKKEAKKGEYPKMEEGLSFEDFMEMFNLPPAGDWIKFRRDGPGKRPDRKPQPYRIKKPEAGKNEKSSIKNRRAYRGVKMENLNFSEFLEELNSPLYEKEGELPKCPPGYVYDKNLVMCVPKSEKDAVSKGSKYGNKDLKPGSGPGYNVFGNSGYSGSGYAFEEPPTSNDVYDRGS